MNGASFHAFMTRHQLKTFIREVSMDAFVRGGDDYSSSPRLARRVALEARPTHQYVDGNPAVSSALQSKKRAPSPRMYPVGSASLIYALASVVSLWVPPETRRGEARSGYVSHEGPGRGLLTRGRSPCDIMILLRGLGILQVYRCSYKH